MKTDNSISIRELILAQVEFDKTHVGGNGRTLYVDICSENIGELEHLAVCLAGEVGEFCNELKKITRDGKGLDENKAALAEELSDALIYILKISAQSGIDIEAATVTKMRMNREKFRKEAK